MYMCTYKYRRAGDCGGSTFQGFTDSVYTVCTQCVHSVYTVCTQYVHSVYTVCTQSVYTV